MRLRRIQIPRQRRASLAPTKTENEKGTCVAGAFFIFRPEPGRGFSCGRGGCRLPGPGRSKTGLFPLPARRSIRRSIRRGPGFAVVPILAPGSGRQRHGSPAVFFEKAFRLGGKIADILQIPDPAHWTLRKGHAGPLRNDSVGRSFPPPVPVCGFVENRKQETMARPGLFSSSQKSHLPGFKRTPGVLFRDQFYRFHVPLLPGLEH